MSDSHDTGRDAVDAQVAQKLRALRLARPVPSPGPDEPSDEEILRYVDGAAKGSERERLEGRGFELQLTLSEREEPVEGARVTLKQAGRTVDSASTEAGQCSFAGLAPARYQLDVRRGAEEIGTLHVDVLQS